MPIVLLLLLASSAAPEAGVSPEVHARTKVLAQHASASYAAGRPSIALTQFEQAYENEPLPSLLFDIAQCHRALNHWRIAASYYRRYLDAVPAAANAAKARALLAEVESKVPATTPAVTAPPPAPAPVAEAALPPAAPLMPTAAPEPGPPKVMAVEDSPNASAPAHNGPPAGALALLIAGGVVVATGIVFGAINLSINAQNHHVGTTDSISRSQAQLEDASGTAAVPLNIVGGAALAGGLAWWLLAR